MQSGPHLRAKKRYRRGRAMSGHPGRADARTYGASDRATGALLYRLVHDGLLPDRISEAYEQQVLLGGRLWQLQVVRGESYYRKTAENFVKEIDLPATRGEKIAVVIAGYVRALGWSARGHVAGPDSDHSEVDLPTLAQRAGIRVAQTRVLRLPGEHALAVRRAGEREQPARLLVDPVDDAGSAHAADTGEAVAAGPAPIVPGTDVFNAGLMTLGSTVTGIIDGQTRPNDVYAIDLTAGQNISVVYTSNVGGGGDLIVAFQFNRSLQPLFRNHEFHSGSLPENVAA